MHGDKRNVVFDELHHAPLHDVIRGQALHRVPYERVVRDYHIRPEVYGLIDDLAGRVKRKQRLFNAPSAVSHHKSGIVKIHLQLKRSHQLQKLKYFARCRLHHLPPSISLS